MKSNQPGPRGHHPRGRIQLGYERPKCLPLLGVLRHELFDGSAQPSNRKECLKSRVHDVAAERSVEPALAGRDEFDEPFPLVRYRADAVNCHGSVRVAE